MKEMKVDTILSIQDLAKETGRCRGAGSKVVHCHGVFDLLHIGHIKYFQEAKTMGNLLVVTITPDRFVNKGPNRPILNQDLRAEALAALHAIDYVAINEWPTAIETIKLLKPDIYVKGPDYKSYEQDITGNILLEEEAVQSIGGKINFTSGPLFSSSSLINNHFSSFTEEQTNYISNIKKNYSSESIKRHLNRFNELNILLVGEAIIDEYVFCNTIGKSGKEPVLVNQKVSSEKYAGGILAVANHLSDFCKSVNILTYLGERNDQKEFIEQSLSPNIELEWIKKTHSPTIIKTRFIDIYTNNKVLGVYDLNDELLNDDEEMEFKNKVDACINNFDFVVVVDYGHGLITSKIVKTLEEKSKYLAVNTQLNSFNIGYHTISKYSNAAYVCVHEGELRHDYRNRHDTVEHLIKKLSKRIKSGVITITRGNAGSIVYKEGRFFECPAFAGKVVDRVGAGDALFAITSLCFVAGIPEDLTLLMGNLAAAEVVASTGTGNKLNKVNLLKAIQTLMK